VKPIVIIGAGPGGYTAAFAAARAGMQVTLVDKGEIGGTCLNTGCIPTKSLRATADALETLRRSREFGLATQTGAEGAAVDMAAVLARKEALVRVLRGGLAKTCASLKIRFLQGRAELAGGLGVRVHTAEDTEHIEAEAIILATGSCCFDLPGLPCDHAFVMNSDDALSLSHLPKKMVIVGGGVIGCEMAFIYRAFGAEVTVVEGQGRLLPLPAVDEEMSRLVQREAKKLGITIELSSTVVRADRASGTCVLAPSGNTVDTAVQKTVETDCVLVTVGRSPLSASLNLGAAGVATDGRGWIVADEHMRTTTPGIYAIGDALGPTRVMLAHAASAEALCAVAAIAGKAEPVHYEAIPSGIFTAPEMGVVGMTEQQAKEEGRITVTGAVQMRELGKAHAAGEIAGFFKLLFEAGSGRILGAQIAGAHATDLVAEAALAVRHGLTARQIAETVHAHPTLAEGIYEAAERAVRALERE